MLGRTEALALVSICKTQTFSVCGVLGSAGLAPLCVVGVRRAEPGRGWIPAASASHCLKSEPELFAAASGSPAVHKASEIATSPSLCPQESQEELVGNGNI